LGTIDILNKHAGALINKPFLETTEEDLGKMLQSNVISHFRMIQNTLPLMQTGATL